MAKYQIAENIRNEELKRWVTDMAELCAPDAVYLCNGSDEEYDRICQEMADAGTFVKLNAEKRPNSFLARQFFGQLSCPRWTCISSEYLQVAVLTSAMICF